MTLNIALTSRHGIYLSSDFRLTYRGGGWKDDTHVQKLIPVLKHDWFGLLSFCGVATTADDREVGAWLAEQANPTNRNQSIGDVVASIRAADEWLSKFALAERQFAVMLTGFQSRRPFFRVLSNFQDGSGQRLPRVTERLQLFQSNARAPSTIAFGVGFSSVQHRDHLASLLARNAHAAIPEAMAHANAATASTTSTVGSECVVGWLQPTGDGQVIPFVRQIDGYFPDWVIRELRAGGVVGWEPKFDAQGKELRPGFTGMTFRIDRAATKGATLATMMSMRNVAALVRDPSIRSAGQAWTTIYDGNATSDRVELKVTAPDGSEAVTPIRFPLWPPRIP